MPPSTSACDSGDLALGLALAIEGVAVDEGVAETDKMGGRGGFREVVLVPVAAGWRGSICERRGGRKVPEVLTARRASA